MLAHRAAEIVLSSSRNVVRRRNSRRSLPRRALTSRISVMHNDG